MSTKRYLLGALTLAFAVLMQLQASHALAKTESARTRLISLATAKGPDCAAPVATCCPKPCITYRHRGPKLCCGVCEPPVETVLKVKDPCTCCDVDVAVCLPACCKGEPKVCTGTGIFGRDVVEYQWCCGYSVKVAFKHSGDLIVTTWGR
jgi:hypothetical protein